jgi:hypothetical protein
MWAKGAFEPERVVSIHVWSEEMQCFCDLRNKGNLALFKASRSVECTDRVEQFLDDVLDEEGYEDQSSSGAFVGPLPGHFLGANCEYANDVLNPKKIIAKGAPPTNKRLKRFHEYLRSKWVVIIFFIQVTRVSYLAALISTYLFTMLVWASFWNMYVNVTVFSYHSHIVIKVVALFA